MPSDCAHLSTIDPSGAAADDSICMEVFHDCNEPAKESIKLAFHTERLFSAVI